MDALTKSGAETVLPGFQARPAWRYAPVLATSLCVLAILLAYWQTAASVVAIWWRSETFAHGFVVVPICLWLTWQRREALAQLAAKPWWPGLALVLLAGAMWLVMSTAEVLGLKQFALAFMIQAAIVTVLGTSVARALVFPLAFLLFAIPAGEILVPTLMDWTADFTINALRWSGVPVYREANHFTIPSGRWSVVEACSGIRYVIASLMVGTIYAAMAYTSTRRRVLFVAASIVVPVVANWLRAYMIVMIGHLSNNRFAVGVDHLIYGWVFFGVVMLLLFWVGSFWQEKASPAPAGPVAPSSSALGELAGAESNAIRGGARGSARCRSLGAHPGLDRSRGPRCGAGRSPSLRATMVGRHPATRSRTGSRATAALPRRRSRRLARMVRRSASTSRTIGIRRRDGSW